MKNKMLVHARNTPRASFKCRCCQPQTSAWRKTERKIIKRRERQQFKRTLDAMMD